MTESNVPLIEEQLNTLHLRLLESYSFVPTLESIVFNLESMQDKSKQLLASDSAYYPVIQDLMVDLETAHEAIDDALKSINDLTQEIEK